MGFWIYALYTGSNVQSKWVQDEPWNRRDYIPPYEDNIKSIFTLEDA
jgi:hypothetical protein